MTYKILETGKDGLNFKVDMSQLGTFNGNIDVSFSIFSGKLYFNSWNIRPAMSQFFGHPEFDENTGMRIDTRSHIIKDDLPEPTYP